MLLGMFLALLLQGCSTNVEVKCGPGGMEGSDKNGIGNKNLVGGCIQPFVPWVNGTAAGFKNTVTKQIIPTPTNLTCSAVGSNKCQSSPGNCGFNKTCRNWYRPTDSFCYCGCP